MLKSIAEDITVVLASNGIIKTEDMEAYVYGMELLLPKAILYVSILIVSIITNTFFISILFVIMLMSLRRYAGGFHCKTAETCLFFSFFIYLLVLFGYNFVRCLPQFIFGISSVISAIVVLLFAPVEDSNRPFEGSEKIQYRHKTMISLTIILLVELIAVFLNLRTLSYISACSLTVNAVLILLSKTRRCEYEINNS